MTVYERQTRTMNNWRRTEEEWKRRRSYETRVQFSTRWVCWSVCAVWGFLLGVPNSSTCDLLLFICFLSLQQLVHFWWAESLETEKKKKRLSLFCERDGQWYEIHSVKDLNTIPDGKKKLIIPFLHSFSWGEGNWTNYFWMRAPRLYWLEKID